jgi:two-component system, NtrC family, response regulator AtoC
MNERLLVVDDDEQMRFFLSEALKKRGYAVTIVSTAEAALEHFQNSPFDIVVTDVRLPGMSGLESLEKYKKVDGNAIIIVMTAYGNKQMALEAVKHGAYDYFTKPFKLDEMEVVIKRALEKKALLEEMSELRDKLENRYEFSNIVGANGTLKPIFDILRRVIPTDTTVLILGESGTGKELIAEAIHRHSRRKGKPFVKLNCAAIPEDLLESELFGHEKGAFTGAVGQKLGRFEMAHQGTILLDEIGDMSTHTQAKILRVLQERQFERVGGTKTIHVDVRIIASTNKDLSKAVRDERFREDLFFRLNVVPIILPPLRERLSDIPDFIHFFMVEINQRLERHIEGVSQESLQRLMHYAWPGNVRELRNCLERAAILTDGSLVGVEALPMQLRGAEAPASEHPAEASSNQITGAAFSLDDKVGEFEKGLMIEALKQVNFVQAAAAKMLGISERSIWHKVKKYAINIEDLKKLQRM